MVDDSNRRAGARAPRRNAVAVRLAARVPRWYSPVAHLLFSVSLTAVVVGVLVAQFVAAERRWWAWLAIPIALVFANAVEYAIHRFPMHRRMRLFDRFFRGHTLVHHRYFDHHHHDLVHLREAYFVLTTAHTMGTSLLILAGAYFGLGAVLGTDVAALATSSMAVYSLTNELMHLAFHFPRAWLARLRLDHSWFLTLRTHHLRHHDPHVMRQWNFNIVMPLMDWVFGTSMPRAAIEARGEAPVGDPASLPAAASNSVAASIPSTGA